MRIYLMQHGKARSKEEDPDRPLTEEGREDVQRVAARLVAADVRPKRVVHSGRTRARETAEELVRVLQTAAPRPAVDEADDLGPTDDTEPWVDRLDGDGRDGTLLVGHLPFMEKLAAGLVGRFEEQEIVRFREGAVLCIERDEAGWTVRWFVTPEVA